MKDNDVNDIFFKRELGSIATNTIFEIIEETEGIRVKNKNVNCYFKGINEHKFEAVYNEYLSYLHLNFEPLSFKGVIYELAQSERQELTEKIITSHIYFYTVNHLSIIVKRSDFLHPLTIDQVIWLLDCKLKLRNRDTELSLRFGAHLLRQNLTAYQTIVKGRRRHYDR